MAPTIDEQAILEKIQSRDHVIKIDEDWLTPSGNYRKAPMFCASIENTYLGLSKAIKARTENEAAEKAKRQLQQWAQREHRQRVADAKEDLRDRAQELTDEAEEEITELRGTLVATLDVDDRIDWQSLLEHGQYAATPFHARPSPNPPVRPFLSYLWPPLWTRRKADHTAALNAHRKKTEALRAAHEAGERAQRDAFNAAKAEKNESIRAFQAAFEDGERDAIEEYVTMVFERSSYPNRLTPAITAHFDPTSRTLVADASIPAPEEVSDVASYKLTDRNRKITPVTLKRKQHEELYDAAVKQLALRILHEVFEAVYVPHVERAVANIWTTTVDRATGHDQTSCIVSVSAIRDAFESLNLARIDPTECIRQLRGLIAGPLSQLAPVKPILTFNRDDPRFIESRDVLAELNAHTNLAEIPWDEFEHLVRDLFGKMFAAHGAEVKVTRSSQDGGVDAVVFDPDPIRGGKFLIQAKRYSKAVPVSASRDLFGAMINEGASKGILVTTAHFGNQTREFAKDKPITLIDGSNLVHLLEQHGHKVRIDFEKKS